MLVRSVLAQVPSAELPPWKLSKWFRLIPLLTRNLQSQERDN